MNINTRQYLINFIDFLYDDLLCDYAKVTWNSVHECEQTVKVGDSKVLTIQRVYRSTDSRIMIKTVTEVSTELIKSIILTICSNVINLYTDSDKLTLAVLKLIKLLDIKTSQINLACDTQAYIDSLLNSKNKIAKVS